MKLSLKRYRESNGAVSRLLIALLAAAVLSFASVRSRAQDDTSGQTNDVPQAQLQGQGQFQSQAEDMTQTGDGAQPAMQSEEATQPENEAAPETENNTSGVTPPVDSRISGRDARSRRFRRQRNQTQNLASSSSLSGTNGNPLDYANFKIVADRNIFDPNRYPARVRPPSQQTLVDSFSLVGTMSYEKGTFAFFSGSSSQYQKALKTSETIAGYKITNIGENTVKLTEGTNQIELRIGMQMRREEEGPWTLSRGSQAYAATPASSNSTSTDSIPSGPGSDVLKRLMQRREQE